MNHSCRALMLVAAVLMVACAGEDNTMTAQSRQLLANAIAAPGSPPPEQVPISFILADTDQGCLKPKPGITVVKHGQVVRWFIENQCAEDVTIELANFHLKESGTPEFPFDPGPLTCSARSGHLCVPIITLHVRDKKPDGGSGAFVYEYDVLLNGTKIDPEIVIEWP